MSNKLTRRGFINTGIKAGMAVAGAHLAITGSFASEPEKKKKPRYDSKGLPVVKLGSTGVLIPRIAIGLGSRFLTIPKTEDAIDMCNYALDNGLYYWDTAHTYVNNATGAVSEERLGHIVKDRRREIFLSTKISERDPEKAKAQIELSLKRLQTDHLDMMKIHAVASPEDADIILKKGGVLDLFTRMKEEGVTRFIGFSGHSNAQALVRLIETGRFDSMLFALNHYDNDKNDRQGSVIPAARKRGMGIMLMKAIRPKETIQGIDTNELVRYALSLDGPSGLAVGMESRKVVDANLAILRNFKPMTSAGIRSFTAKLHPFFASADLPWMHEDYRDGQTA